MSKAVRKRDNQYCLDRLRDEHAGIFADYQAGKFKNAAAAILAAGLRKQQDILVVLKSACKKANAAEQETFKLLIGCVVPVLALPPTAMALSVPLSPSAHSHVSQNATILQTKRKLSPVLAAAVRQIIDRRKLKTGQIMCEMGMNPLDTSLGRALYRDTQVRDDLVKALEVWSEKNTQI